MTICGLDATPFTTREGAKIAAALDPDSFAVTQLSNDSRWWYYVSLVGTQYRINFKDTYFPVPKENNSVFSTLKSRLGDNILPHDPTAYITEPELINEFVDPVTVAPKVLVLNNQNIKESI